MDSKALLEAFNKNGFVKFGRFKLKNGSISSMYIDCRLLNNKPELLDEVAQMMAQKIMENAATPDQPNPFDKLQNQYLLGVPYGAIPVATLIARHLKMPLLVKRKELDPTGRKEMFTNLPDNCKLKVIVIEDVVTTGSSICETLAEVRKAGMACTQAFCIVDRQQGAAERLQDQFGVALHSLIKVDAILDYFGHELVIESPEDLRGTTNWSIQSRMAHFPEGSLNRRLGQIMLAKKSNLCVAVESKKDILKVADCVKHEICALKLHCADEGMEPELARKLQQMAHEHNFLLFEDRKYADIGNTMQFQLMGHASTTPSADARVPVANWADLVTVHSLPGASSIQGAFIPIIESANQKLSGLLLIAQMSTAGALTSTLADYVGETVKVAEECGPGIVSGFICQQRCHDNPAFLYWTPGVNMAKSGDGKGQQWRTPKKAIKEDKCDIIIVGRGITQATDVGMEARKYREAAWEAYDGN